MTSESIDEALCLAKFLDRHATRIEVLECSGTWSSPVEPSTDSRTNTTTDTTEARPSQSAA